MLVKECRICRSRSLVRFLDLGNHPPADEFLFKHQLGPAEQSYPLRVLLCTDCGLSQLDWVVPPETLYCNDYPYESSTTAAGREHWDEFAGTVVRMMALTDGNLVVDIGSNVGVLLQMFARRGVRVLGVDPAANIAEIAKAHGVSTLVAFFNSDTALRIRDEQGRASVITGTNVIAHINDLHDMMRGVDALLTATGVFIMEAPYMVDLVRALEYDTIYHEHLSYFSLKPLIRFFSQFGMEIFEVQRRDIHGGSFRVFVRRIGSSDRPVSSVIAELLGAEQREGITDLERLQRFASDVAQNREDLRQMLAGLKRSGKRIAGVSAPAKGMTLLNYCAIGLDLLDFVTEKSRLKIGRFTPGMHIPVVADEALFSDPPDYALLLAWNFADEIMRNLREFSNRGGKFIIPIPRPTIVG
ncbi:MAG TPA: class I SAM-dependent methyltransferase [Candidatus Sulfotelmatobacter sp.]|nr:class I SAM-dependent methyltransferase [Candidatus Sulfotelmatobacter sp.]